MCAWLWKDGGGSWPFLFTILRDGIIIQKNTGTSTLVANILSYIFFVSLEKNRRTSRTYPIVVFQGIHYAGLYQFLCSRQHSVVNFGGPGPPLCSLDFSLYSQISQESKMSSLGSLVNRVADDQGGVSRDDGYTGFGGLTMAIILDLLLWLCSKAFAVRLIFRP